MSSTPSRLFVALMPSESVMSEVERVVDQVRMGTASVKGAEDIRWLSKERWHVTVCFLGAVHPDQLKVFSHEILTAIEHSSVIVWRLAGCRASPSLSRARVLWAEAEELSGSLGRLHRAVRRAAVASGLSVEHRRFRPHLTLARVRSGSQQSAPAVRQAVEALAVLDTEPTVSSTAVLIRSHLGPDPRYELLESWPLAAGPSTPARG